MKSKWLWLLLGAFVFFAGCGGDDDDDCPSCSEPDDDDDDAADDDDTAPDDDDDDAAVCTEGETRCDPDDIPELCLDGAWEKQAACSDWTYCNYGLCQDVLIDLPFDESPHRDLVEWWYWTGDVSDADGNVYGFELTFFYAGRLFGIPAWMIHAGVVDLATGEHQVNVWLDIYNPTEWPEPFVLESRDALVTREDDTYLMSAVAGDFAFELSLTDTQGPVYHGGNGSIRMSTRTTDSFYYSRPRMDVSGILFRDGEPLTVTGEAWMDHQWGSFNPFVLYGWDWFSMRFEDGAEIMYFVFRGDEHNPFIVDMALGTYIEPDGDQRLLSQDEVDITILNSWTSSVTGGVYPQNWRFRVPSLDLDVDLIAPIADQEVPNLMWNYWEGLVDIEGEKGGVPAEGHGFVELSGYAGRPLLWFLFADQWDKSAP